MRLDPLEAIRPNERLRVMDLVRDAGIDVSDWANYKGRHPAANPKYCYEWAFIDKSNVAVFNLWFEDMEADASGAISQQMNYRQFAIKIEANGGRPVWGKRARNLDLALQDAIRQKLPVRVIVNEGSRADIERNAEIASKVERRRLDDLNWTIAEYDWKTGDCRIVRGLDTPRFLDQFSAPASESRPERTLRTGIVFDRSAAVRQAALARAGGRCEYCGQLGFVTAAGGIYLETHHVIPLGEGGLDMVLNVAALCPGHHREAHYGLERDRIREVLLAKLGMNQ